MTDKVIENNQVTVMGEVVSYFSYSHEIYGEGFYMVDIKCTRLSDSFDIIPVMVSERLLDVTASYVGMLLCVNGQFRSYNRHEERKNRLELSVFAEHFKVGERCAIWGRIQSREYMKKLDEEHVEKRVAFEVSVSKLELLEEAQGQESIV